MKKLILIFGIAFSVSITANAQLKVHPNGKVHVGGSNNNLYNEALTVEGTVRFSAWNDILLENTSSPNYDGNPFGGWCLRP